MKKRLGLPALLLVVAVVAAGCGKSTTTGGQAGGGGSAERLGGYLTASVAKKPCTIGISVPEYVDPFWIAIVYGATDEAKKSGCKVAAVYQAGGYANLTQQIQQMENLAQLKVNAILFAPVDYKGTAAIADQIASQGITVINLANMSESAKVAYGVNNYDPAIGQRFADWIGQKTNGTGQVCILSGPAGANWAEDRVSGFKQELQAKYPNMKILAEKNTEIDPAVAQQTAENWLVAFPKIDAIISVAAPLGEGAANAVQAAGKKGQTLVMTSTLNEGTLNMLKAGLIDYVQSERPVLTGRLGTQLAIKALNGESVTIPATHKATISLPEHILYLDAPFYTPADVSKIDTSLDWAPAGWNPSQY